MTEAIPLSRPDITDIERQAVCAVLQTDRLSFGPYTQKFEAAVAGLAGRKHGIAVNSGTSALHLCVRALGIQKGDEVITTPFSFVATTNCILYEDATPVFVDVDPDSYNMDPSAVEAAITPRTKAILPVEVFGNPTHFDAYERIARKHGLRMIEDSCEALGARLNGRPAGNFGDCSVFAFYPNKQITTGEGGMIVTDSDEISAAAHSMRNQGRSSRRWLAHEQLGYNYRLTDVSAAMGVAQMQRLEEILERRRQVAQMYIEALGDIEEIHLPPCPDREIASWFIFVVRLADTFSAEMRHAVVARLRSHSIGCEVYFAPIHLQPFIQQRFGLKRGSFPICEAISDRTVALPFFSRMTLEQVRYVAEHLRAAIASCR